MDIPAFQPIGFVHSSADPPPRHWSVSDTEAVLRMNPAYESALAQIEKGQRIVVIFCFHKSRKFTSSDLFQMPPHRQEAMGVFSICSPVRPNPIGMSVVKVLEKNGCDIRVKHIDMIDGTPILDIKPHVENEATCPSWRGPSEKADPDAEVRMTVGPSEYLKDLRRLVGTRRIFTPGVRALIVNERQEILFQRRTDSGQWGLPGGAVEPDETAPEALRREVAEETGLEVLQAEPMGLYSGRNQRFAYPNGDQVQCFAVAFIVSKWRGKPKADGQEGSELRFFPLSHLPENLVPVHRPTLSDFGRYHGEFILSE